MFSFHRQKELGLVRIGGKVKKEIIRGCPWLVLEEVGSVIIRVFEQITGKTASEG
jgi:dissimilatory sulfite reductase (desulfoviridin) alpha/beta subunit